MDIAQKLRSEGFKVTPQRLAIYNALFDFDKHPNAEMIYRNLHTEYPTISLATVYKSMEIFEKIGVVRVLNLGGDSSRYDYEVHLHPHICCSICGRVDDVEGVDMESIFERLHENSNYEVLNTQIVFEGICPDCLQKGKDNKELN